jgi:hypothetical protein
LWRVLGLGRIQGPDKLRLKNEQGKVMAEKNSVPDAVLLRDQVVVRDGLATHGVSGFQSLNVDFKHGGAAANKTRVEQALSAASVKVPLFRKP